MRALTDHQRVRLLSEPDAEVETKWLSLYGEFLRDQGLPAGLKAYFLRIDEQPMDREYATWYPELVVARERLMLEVNRSFHDELVELNNSLDTYRARRSPKDGIEERVLKNVALGLIAVDDSPESHRMIMDHLERATSPADRVYALTALNRSSAHERRQYLENVYQEWHSHTSGYPNYLGVVSSGTRDDVFDMIEAERSRDTFDVNQPSLCRALFVTMAANNKMVWTDKGIQWVTDTVIYLAGINQYTASRLLNTFQQYRKLRPYLQEKVQPALKRIVETVSVEVSRTVHAQAQAYLGRAD
jgi:aminopeptidase N